MTVLGNVLVSIVLARSLGSEGLGLYAIFSVLGLLVIPLTVLALPTAVTKFVSELRDEPGVRLSPLLGTAMTMLLVAAAAGSVFLFSLGAPLFGTLYMSSEVTVMVEILAVFLIANSVALFTSAFLQGLEEFPTTSLIGGVAVLLNVALLLVLVPAAGVVGAALAAGSVAALNAALGLVAMRRILRRRMIPWRWTIRRTEARRLARYSGPLLGASLLARSATFVQSSFVAIYLGFGDLGLLRVAAVFFGAIMFVPRSALAPMLPVLANAIASRSPERVREILTQLVKFALLLGAPMAGALVLALPAAIDILFGSEYLVAESSAIVYIILALVAFPTAILGEQYLLARGRTVTSLVVTAYSAATATTLMVLFLPVLGAIALPLAGLVAEGTLLILIAAWAHDRAEIHVSRLGLPAAFASLSIIACVEGAAVLPAAPRLFLAPVAGIVLGLGAWRLLSPTERNLVSGTLAHGLARLRGRRAPPR